MTAEIFSKSGGQVVQVETGAIKLESPSIVRLQMLRSDISSMERVGNNLVLKLTNGETVTIPNFYKADVAASEHNLVIQEPGGEMWLARPDLGANYFELANWEELNEPVIVAAAGMGMGGILAGGAALGGLGIAAAGGGGGDGDNGGGGNPNPDTTAPLAPTEVEVSEDGAAVTGKGEPGGTATVYDEDGETIATGPIGDDGNFSVELDPPLTNGEEVTVTVTDEADNEGPPSDPATAPDTTDPLAPTEVEVSEDGAAVTGKGEPGGTATVYDEDGEIIATGPIGDDGNFSIELDPPLTNGEEVTVTVTDDADNEGPPSDPATAPDTTDPLAPTEVEVSEDGAAVTGKGEPGGTATVYDEDGEIIATGPIGDDGNFSIELDPPLTNGEEVTVTVTDDADNEGPPSDPATAPDTTDPLAPTEVEVSEDGAAVTGKGEPGGTATVYDEDGEIIATGPIGDDGNFSIELDPPLTNGEEVTVTVTDDADNEGPPSDPATAPDSTRPLAPTDVAVGDDGLTVTGMGEAGTTASVYNQLTGEFLGEVLVPASGAFTVGLSEAQLNGEKLIVVLTDAADLVSDAAPVTAPDEIAPLPPTQLAISPDGATLTGRGEAGTKVFVDGVEVGTVGNDGGFSVPLSPPKIDGEQLNVTLLDGGGNESDPPATVLAPDETAPDAPTILAVVNESSDVGGGSMEDRTVVSGTGEEGATVTVYDADGNEIGGGTVDGDGEFTIVTDVLLANGEAVDVRLTDAAGNPSELTRGNAPDTTGPAVPDDLAVQPGGATLTGEGEVGATVIVVARGGDPEDEGAVLGTTTVLEGGLFTVPLDPVQNAEQELDVYLIDGDGNFSVAGQTTGWDGIAPDAATNVSVDANGAIVTGEAAENLLTVNVYRTGPPRILLGTGTVEDGEFNVILQPAQVNGEALVVELVDAAGNISDPTPVSAPDLDDRPSAPTDLVVADDGTSVSGESDAPLGSPVTVYVDGVVVGAAAVGVDGTFEATLVPPLVDGETLSVTVSAGIPIQISPVGVVQAPDLVIPNADSATANILLEPATSEWEPGADEVDFTVSLLAIEIGGSGGLLDLDIDLGLTPIIFNVDPGTEFEAKFTTAVPLSVGLLSDVGVVVQKWDGANWVALAGSGDATLLSLELLNLVTFASYTFGPGEYRAYIGADAGITIGALNGLLLTGNVLDYTVPFEPVGQVLEGNVLTNDVKVVAPVVGTYVSQIALDGEAPVAVLAGVGRTITTDFGDLTIYQDGSYEFTPDPVLENSGETLVFTYSVATPTHPNVETATLTITLATPDIEGTPDLVADVGTATANFVYKTDPPETTAQGELDFPLISVLATRSTTFDLTVGANQTATVSLIAKVEGLLSALQSISVTVKDELGITVYQEEGAALVTLPLLGINGAIFDLSKFGAFEQGTYTVTVSSFSGGGVGSDISLETVSVYTDLAEFVFANAADVTGNILENDDTGGDFFNLYMDTDNDGAIDDLLGSAPSILEGDYGTLTIDASGNYSYSINSDIEYESLPKSETFDYIIMQADGTNSQSQLEIVINPYTV